MDLKSAFFGALCFVLFHGVVSFSVSVPPVRSVCRMMVPGHDKIKPQTSESPFSLITDISTSVSSNDTIEVTLFGRDGKKFKGFYIQARDVKNSPIGTFNANTFSKTHSCGGIKGNAAHHVNSEEKSKVTISWKAPQNYIGDVQFQATAVENYVTFWTPIKAALVKIA